MTFLVGILKGLLLGRYRRLGYNVPAPTPDWVKAGKPVPLSWFTGESQ